MFFQKVQQEYSKLGKVTQTTNLLNELENFITQKINQGKKHWNYKKGSGNYSEKTKKSWNRKREFSDNKREIT